MRIIKIAFKEECPHCGYQNEINVKDRWIVCENCGGGWEPFMYSGKVDDPQPFKDPPFPVLDNRSIRS